MRFFTFATALAGILWLSAGVLTVAHARRAMTADTLQQLCALDHSDARMSCISYIDGAISVMEMVCGLEKQGQIHAMGLFSIDLPSSVSTADVADVFMLNMKDSEFRGAWGDDTANIAVYFAALDLWPCNPE